MWDGQTISPLLFFIVFNEYGLSSLLYLLRDIHNLERNQSKKWGSKNEKTTVAKMLDDE